jgi:hypothetical protein
MLQSCFVNMAVMSRLLTGQAAIPTESKILRCLRHRVEG